MKARPTSSRLALAALLSSCLAACSTVPTIDSSRQITADRQLALQAPVADGASVIVLRDRSFSGSLVNYRLLVDGKVAAELGTGEYVTLHVPAGECLLEVRHPSATLGAIGDSQTLRADARARYYYRVNSDIGQIRLLRTTEESILTQQPQGRP